MDDLSDLTPWEFREKVRAGLYHGGTSGVCRGYVQANLVILPQKYAEDFLLFAKRNPKPCPILEYTKPGDPTTHIVAENGNITTDLPGYRIFRNGKAVGNVNDISDIWRDDLVGFLIGCSYSFEFALMEAGLEIRCITDKNIGWAYETCIPCAPSHYFSGPIIASMRPFPADKIDLVYEVTSKLPHAHGTPIYHGDPAKIGVSIDKPYCGDLPRIEPGEVPVFWGCGVTPQLAIEHAAPDLAITHDAGHMFITDIRESELEERLTGVKL